MSGFDIFLTYVFTFAAGLAVSNGGEARGVGIVVIVIVFIIAITRVFTLAAVV